MPIFPSLRRHHQKPLTTATLPPACNAGSPKTPAAAPTLPPLPVFNPSASCLNTSGFAPKPPAPNALGSSAGVGPVPGPTVAVGSMLLQANQQADRDLAAVPCAALADLVLTLTTEQNLRLLAAAWKRGRPALLEGPTSSGKTSAVRYLAYKTQSPYRRINLSHGSDVGDLLGRYIGGERRYELEQLLGLPAMDLARIAKDYGLPHTGAPHSVAAAICERQMEPRWVDGPVVKALKRGETLVLDEINLAPAAVIERLNSLFDDDRNIVLVEHRNEVIVPSDHFRVFATMNPGHYSGREALSAAMRSRWNPIKMRGLQQDDLWQIMQTRFGEHLPKAELSKLITFHTTLTESVDKGTLGQRGALSFTLRDLLKVGHRFTALRGRGMDDKDLMRREAEEVYTGGLLREDEKLQVRDSLRLAMPCSDTNFYEALQLTEFPDRFCIGDVQVPKINATHPLVPDTQARLVLTPRTKEILYRLAKALEMGENVALIGERASGKTAIAKLYAHLRGQPYHRQIFSASTDVAQIIGGYDDQGWKDGLLLTCGREEQTPGVFLGDEFNLTSPALLERLNSVLDDERMLALNEREGEIVKMAKHFRFVAAMNPPTRSYAGREKLSTAMQNRFTQLVVPDITLAQEQRTIASEVAAQKGIPLGWSDKLVAIHRQVVDAYNSETLGSELPMRDKPTFSLRQLLEALAVIQSFQGDLGVQDAFRLAIETQYAAAVSDNDRRTIMGWI